MDRDQVGVLLTEAKRVTNHCEFVIIGSLSILGKTVDAPPDMTHSIDVDMFPRADPGRIEEINRELGQGTDFEDRHGYYADGVSPQVATLPEGWEGRLISVRYPEDVVGYYLDPDDAAVAKLARLEARDLRWVKSGVAAGILNPDEISRRMLTANFLDQDEFRRARDALARIKISVG